MVVGRPKKNPEPELEIPDIVRRQPVLPLRCGDCVFLNKYQTYGAPCEKFGTVPSSVPCSRFSADPTRLGDVHDIRDALKVLTRAKSPLLMTAIMVQARRLKQFPFQLGDVVYFRVLGKDYLSNYASAVVTGATQDQIIVAGARSFVALVNPNSLMTYSEWEKCKTRLIKQNKINDPQGGLRRVAMKGQERLNQYQPPELKSKREKKVTPSAFTGKEKKVVTVTLAS